VVSLSLDTPSKATAVRQAAPAVMRREVCFTRFLETEPVPVDRIR
jgi:hypothetical protein